MNDRIKKLSSWSIPIVVIAGVLYLTVSFIDGDGIGGPQKYARQFSLMKPFFASLSSSVSASVSLLWEKINTATSPEQTGSVTTPADSHGSIPTPQKTPPANSYVVTPTSTSSKNGFSPRNNPSPLFTEGIPRTTFYSSNRFTSSTNSARVPDLAIQIVDTGILGSDDVFTHATSVQPGQRAAVVFDIKNIGRGVSPEWNFSAEIPTPDRNFTSETQAALAPGEGIRFTMAFSNLGQNATNTISFIVDPNTKVPNDPDRNNNVASTTFFRNY